VAIERGVQAGAVVCPAWAPPLLALQFLTRIPVPGLARLSPDVVNVALGRAVGWFPLVGALVGAVTAGTMLGAEQFWPRIVAVLLALAVEARLTGAFHEDAVADFCDGIGGGRDPAHVRQIMKDSRIGSYGALGLVLAVALRAALMLSLPASPMFVFVAIVAASTFGRLIAVVAMSTIPPASDNAASAGAPGGSPSLAKDITSVLPSSALVVAAVTAAIVLLPFALLAPLALLVAIVATAVFLVWLRALLLRKIGGITGDCLGFGVYVGQLIVLLAAIAAAGA
jgi:adenosylcobinamide-GDP ribazoletransferase